MILDNIVAFDTVVALVALLTSPPVMRRENTFGISVYSKPFQYSYTSSNIVRINKQS
jgi:predicted tellurium resistance membrane protein TerC